jgi:hypothetical protein
MKNLILFRARHRKRKTWLSWLWFTGARADKTRKWQANALIEKHLMQGLVPERGF